MKTSLRIFPGYYVQRSSSRGFGVFEQSCDGASKARKWFGKPMAVRWFWSFQEAWNHAQVLAGKDSIFYDSKQLD